jgi:hypothetical protein
MIGKVLAGAAALSMLACVQARAQGPGDVPAMLAAAEEQLGQGVGEAALGGSSVFVTAKGVARLDAPASRIYAVTIEDEGVTATDAAKGRDAKLDRLRAVAKRFSVEMTPGDYGYTRPNPPVAPIRTIIPAPAAAAPGAAPPPLAIAPIGGPKPSPRLFTANVAVRFTRPPEASMPAFLDALHDAGVETLNAANIQPNNPVTTALLGLGAASPEVNEAVWTKAAAAAMAAARQQAEVLASAGGRHVGQVRQIIQLARTVQGDQATVMVAARFAFAP